MSLSVRAPLFHGPSPLCQTSYPALPYLDSFYLVIHMAHTALVGSLPSIELEEMSDPLSPPEWSMRFPMLYHTLGLLGLLGVFAKGVIPGHVAMVQGHFGNLVLLPRGNSILFKLD